MAKAKKGKLSIEEMLVSTDIKPYEIPDNWCWIHLLDSFDNVTDSKKKLATKEYLEDGEYPIIDQGQDFIGGYTDDGGMIYDGELPIVIFGDHTRCIKYIDFPFAQGADGVKVLKPKKFWDAKAFYYAMQSVEIPNMGYRRHYPLFKDFCIPVPPLAEQKRIVEQIENLFFKLDEARERTQSALDEYETRKQAILYKAFSGGLSNEWRVENNKSIEEWEYKQLGDTNIEIIDGDRGKNYPTKDEFSPEGYCIFLNAKNVTKNGFNFDVLECITKEKDELLHKGRLERGDMIMTTRGTLGNVAIYDETVPYEHLRINSGMVIYRGGEEIYKPYLIWLYKSNMITQQIDRMQTGSAQPQLPIKVMKSLLIPIPSVEEQEVIVDCIQSMMDKEEQVKSTIINVIENIDMMKKSVLAKAFRGQLGTNNLEEESSIELLKNILEM